MRIRLSFLLAMALAFLSACVTVPVTGRKAMVLIPDAQMDEMGAQAYSEMKQSTPVSRDRKKVEMVERIGRRIAKASSQKYDWEFVLFDDPKTVNAFCLPGGKVAFYTGILPVTATEDGTAVVMSHEIAHALARHGAERMSQGLLAQTGGKLLGAVLGAGPAAGQASNRLYEQLYGLGAGLVVLSYSRNQESEADHIGLILMQKAGYNMEEGIAFWGRMAKATEGKRSGGPLDKFLATHPASQERQAQIQKWIPEIRAKYPKLSP